MRGGIQRWWIVLAVGAACLTSTRNLAAQSFGVELNNTLMPAAGGMGGVGIAAPQDLLAAIHANPGTLTQFSGTQVTFGGAWAESTFDMNYTGALLPGVDPFSAKSSQPGSLGGNIGITQDLSELGMPAVFGTSFTTEAGGGVNFRGVPASHGTSSSLAILGLTSGLGVSLTDRLSAGATMSVGTGFFDGPFVGLGAMTTAYAIRGSFGLTYQALPSTTLGFYYQTKQTFKFQDAILLELGPGVYDTARDIHLSLPENLGFGIANTSLMDGNLLLGVDLLYKLWDAAALFDSVYVNQLVVQFGAQYSYNDWRFRAGYVWAQNPLQSVTGTTAGGVAPPGAVEAIQYLQAQFAVINQNRITFGIGRKNVLPGMDFDLFAGGMFRDGAQLGATSVSVESYWAGFGLTWRFGRGSCQRLPVPDSWSES